MAAGRAKSLRLQVDERQGGAPARHAAHPALRDDIQRSFEINGECFIKGDIAINATGVAMRDADKSFTVVFEELALGEVRGCSRHPFFQITGNASILPIRASAARDPGRGARGQQLRPAGHSRALRHAPGPQGHQHV